MSKSTFGTIKPAMKIDETQAQSEVPIQDHHRDMGSPLPLLRGSRLYWICQTLGWGSVLLINWIHLLTDPPSAHVSLGYSTTCLLYFAVTSHFYRMFIHWKGWKSLTWQRLLPRCLLASLAIALAHLLSFKLIIYLAGMGGGPFTPWHMVFVGFTDFALMTVWAAIYFSYHLDRRYQKTQIDRFRLEASLREAEHRALSAQVNPHFLFNCLNTLRSMIDENPEKARQAVSDLSRLFRASLKTSDNSLISLREEMEAVRSYLSLEKLRFEDQLVVSDDLPDKTLDAKLPPFLLQTLIENAVKYGGRTEDHVNEISYCARLEEKGLKIRVTNSGQIRAPGPSATGIGLKNARLRLDLLFGANASLDLTSPEENVVQAEALIPQNDTHV